MKKIILEFKSLQDYEKFLEVSEEQNKLFQDHERSENDDSITFLFEDSEVIMENMNKLEK